MKYFFLALVAFAIIPQAPKAQQSFTVEQGQNFSHAIPSGEAYMFPSFRDAAVYYKSKNVSGGHVNYNYLTQELSFISPKGDTLPVDAPEEIDSIVAGSDKLFFCNGFVKLDTVLGHTKLAMGCIFSPADKRVVGYNGISTSSTSNMQYVQFKLNPATHVVADEQTVLLKATVFYIGTRLNSFLPASKKNLHKFYSKKENSLKAYLSQNDVKYSSRDSLIKLIAYMEGQQ